MKVNNNIFKKMKYYEKKIASTNRFFHRKKHEELLAEYEKDKVLLKKNSLFSARDLAAFICEKLSTYEKDYFEKYFDTDFFEGYIITTKKGYEIIENADQKENKLEDILKLLDNEDHIVIDFEGKSIIEKICIIDDNLEIKESFVKNHPQLKEKLEKLVNIRVEEARTSFVEHNTYLLDTTMQYDRRFHEYLINKNTDFNVDDVEKIDFKIDQYGFPTDNSWEYTHTYHLMFKNKEEREILTLVDINWDKLSTYKPNEHHYWKIDINKLTTEDKLKLMLVELNYVSNYEYNIYDDRVYKFDKELLKSHALLFKYLKEDTEDEKYTKFYNKFEEVLDARTDADEWIRLNKLKKDITNYLNKKTPITYKDNSTQIIKFPTNNNHLK